MTHFTLINSYSYHLLIDEVGNEPGRRSAERFIVPSESLLEIHNEAAQDEVDVLWELQQKDRGRYYRRNNVTTISPSQQSYQFVSVTINIDQFVMHIDNITIFPPYSYSLPNTYKLQLKKAVHHDKLI